MTSALRPFIAGNWKMNGSKAVLGELDAMGAAYDEMLRQRVELMICLPFPYIGLGAERTKSSGLTIGGQDCHANAAGAHTGDVSAEMLADLGAKATIVGHSERRTDHHETDSMVKAKAEAALRAGLMAIVCVGETKAEREAGKALDIVRGQLKGSLPQGAKATHIVIAYEPVWAIGTGLVPTAKDVEEVHAAIRADLIALMGADEGSKTRIVYGGSVKPSNVKRLIAVKNVDGALVGGASLKAADFLGIVEAYR